MKRKRFTEEQIIAVLKEHEAGAKTADFGPQARDIGGDVRQLVGQVRRDGRLGAQAAQGPRMLDAAALRELLSKKW